MPLRLSLLVNERRGVYLTGLGSLLGVFNTHIDKYKFPLLRLDQLVSTQAHSLLKHASHCPHHRVPTFCHSPTSPLFKLPLTPFDVFREALHVKPIARMTHLKLCCQPPLPAGAALSRCLGVREAFRDLGMCVITSQGDYHIASLQMPPHPLTHALKGLLA